MYCCRRRFAHDIALDVPRSRTFLANGSHYIQAESPRVFAVHRRRGRCPRRRLYLHSRECCRHRQSICHTFSSGSALNWLSNHKKKLSCALFFQPFPSFLRSAKLVIKHLKWQSCKKPFHSFNWKWNQVYVPPSLINLGLISNCISSLRLNRMKTKSFTSKIYQLEINFCTCIDNTSLKESLQIGSASESGAVQLRRRNNNIGTSYHGTVYSYWWRFAHDFALDVPRSRTFIANGSNDVQTQPSHVFVVHRHRGRCPRWWLHVHSWECCWYRQPICNTFSPGSALHRR